MNEALFGRLAVRLEAEPVILASVLHTRGATPRKAGARMLIAENDSEFSVGGGLAEARVIAAARALLEGRSGRAATLGIDLSGRAESAGVCGGHMAIALRRWQGDDDARRARQIADNLRAGRSATLSPDDIGADIEPQPIAPDPRLLIVGGGHCGLALYQLASYLDFDLCVFDPRPEYAQPAQFPRALCLSGDFSQLRAGLHSGRALYAVLLNRDFASDVATLQVIAGADFAFLGMMGSARRIAQVLAALPQQADQLTALQAPVGIEIDAQTPHEIAVSVLAQLIERRRRLQG